MAVLRQCLVVFPSDEEALGFRGVGGFETSPVSENLVYAEVAVEVAIENRHAVLAAALVDRNPRSGCVKIGHRPRGRDAAVRETHRETNRVRNPPIRRYAVLRTRSRGNDGFG